MPSSCKGWARSPVRISMPSGSTERSLVERTRAIVRRSASRAATALPRKPVPPTSRILSAITGRVAARSTARVDTRSSRGEIGACRSPLPDDVAQQLQVLRSECVAVVVLNGKGATVAREQGAQIGIGAQAIDGRGQLVTTFGLD